MRWFKNEVKEESKYMEILEKRNEPREEVGLDLSMVRTIRVLLRERDKLFLSGTNFIKY